MTETTYRTNGLEYNTEREKLRLKAYGREVQQMVDLCVALPTKEERQSAAEAIIDTMKRIIPSQQSFKERTPMLWYHLALMSDFKLDVDYPVEFPKVYTMSTPPEAVEYNKNRIKARHYGKLLFNVFDKLKEMPDGPLRHQLAVKAAMQMQRCLDVWGAGSTQKERVVSDLARYTDGVIQLSPNDFKSQVSKVVSIADIVSDASGSKKKKKKK